MYETKSKRPKIGLALGSGGARGLAHIGVIKMLEKNNIPIDFISGASIGALIGGLYAASKNIKNIEKMALATNWHQLLFLIDPSFSQGLVGGEKIKKFIETQIECVHFQDLKIPFSLVATDFKNGETVCIDDGEVAPAIRASISVPLVFKPVEWGKKLLADGGLSMPVPAEIVREMGADIVIAVNLDADYFSDNEKEFHLSFYKTADRAISLLRHHLAFWNVKDADVVVCPKAGKRNWVKFVDGEEVILLGEKAMKEKLPQLLKLMGQNEKK